MDREKPPYIISIFFVSLGWVLVHYIESLEKSPVLSYEIEEIEEGNYRITVRNLSSDVVFDGIELSLEVVWNETQIIMVNQQQPADKGKVASSEDDNVSFEVDKFHPGMWLYLDVPVSERPKLRLTRQKRGKESLPRQAIRLTSSPWEIWPLRYKFWYMFGLLSAWGILLLVGWKVSSKRNRYKP